MNTRLISREDEVEEDVSWDDQKRICAFGRKNARMHELEADIHRYQEDVENLEDASTEVLLMDADERMSYQLGDVFVVLSQADVEARLAGLKELAQAKIAAAEAEIATLRQEMAELKVVLYAKFKGSINLEEDASEDAPRKAK